MPESRQLRTRHAELIDSIDRLDSDVAGATAVLAITGTVTTYPTTAGRFYAVNPVELDGSETEGSSATFTADSSRTFFAFNLGTEIPPAGTYVILHSVGGAGTSGMTGEPVPDALIIPESAKRGARQIDRINSVLDIAEPLLGVDRSAGQRAYIRRQPGEKLFITRDPADTLKFPTGHRHEGRERYRWEDRGDMRYGWLADE